MEGELNRALLVSFIYLYGVLGFLCVGTLCILIEGAKSAGAQNSCLLEGPS